VPWWSTLSIALLALMATFGVALPVRAQEAPARNAGVYVVNGAASTQALPQSAYSRSYIDGVDLVFSWSAVEPQDGVYDWSAIDSQIAAAAAVHKKVTLGVQPGVFSPSWLYDEGAASFLMQWTAAGWGFPLCSMVPLPLPWDPVYQSKWLAFIAQLGQRYARNKAVVMVKIQGVNSSTTELFLPYTRPGGPGAGQSTCPQIDNVAAWLAAGYRPSLIVGSWRTFARAFVHAFPRTYAILETGTWPLPPISNTGETGPNYGGDYKTPQTIISAGALIAGSSFVVQNDQLTAVFAWPRPANLPLTDAFGYQAAWNVDQDPSCRMNGFVTPCNPATVMDETVANALANAVTYLEVYQSDAQDTSEAPALRRAHDVLTGLVPP